MFLVLLRNFALSLGVSFIISRVRNPIISDRFMSNLLKYAGSIAVGDWPKTMAIFITISVEISMVQESICDTALWEMPSALASSS